MQDTRVVKRELNDRWEFLPTGFSRVFQVLMTPRTSRAFRQQQFWEMLEEDFEEGRQGHLLLWAKQLLL